MNYRVPEPPLEPPDTPETPIRCSRCNLMGEDILSLLGYGAFCRGCLNEMLQELPADELAILLNAEIVSE